MQCLYVLILPSQFVGGFFSYLRLWGTHIAISPRTTSEAQHDSSLGSLK